jgi:4-amino-4-deoxy-L-arabinose transferase-like glycosyltransferase
VANPSGESPPRSAQLAQVLRSPLTQVAIIFVVAAAFRFWAIDRLPPGLFGDEAAEGLDALDVLAGRGAVFFPANYGREGLYIWFVAGSIKLLGVTPFATRLPAILLGIATCLLTWSMARELIRALPPGPSPRVHASLRAWGPLIAGLFLATSYWHVHFSRFSQRTILTPFAIALAVWGFWAGVNTGRLRWWALAGLGVGLALHSYSVGRFFPVLIALFLAVDWLLRFRSRVFRPVLSRHWRGVLLMIALAALIFAPLAYYFLTHPGSFFQRASAVATYAGGGQQEMLATVARSALANAAQYVVPGAGDKAQFHNLPGRPIFEPLTAVLALAGLAWCLARPRQPVALFLLLWVAVMTRRTGAATGWWSPRENGG